MILPLYRELPGSMPLHLGNRFKSFGLTMNYFPLRADLAQLTRFCDEYLNFAADGNPLPDEMGHFRPRFPLVYMILADHPRLEALDSGRILVQRELAFSIPVEHRRKEQGRYRSYGFGWTQPFIYIDSPLGLTTGRQVWGWPKAMASFDVSSWAERGGRVQMTLAELGGRTLVEIRRDAGTETRSGMGMKGVLDLWSNLASGYATTLRGIYEPWIGFGRTVDKGRASPAQEIQEVIDCVEILWRQLPNGLRFEFELPIITLKQFHDPIEPSYASYQAIVRSPTQFSKPRASLLGPDQQIIGDMSGGLRVDIHAHPLQPIVERLGLLPDDKMKTGSGDEITTFKPIMPFRVTFDASYDAGDVLAWRPLHGSWRQSSTPDQAPRQLHVPSNGILGNPYNTARGPDEPCKPPSGDMRLDVYPMQLADGKQDDLQTLVAGYLGTADSGTVINMPEPWVYLVVTHVNDRRHLTSFCVPLHVTREGSTGPGWFIPFEYASDGHLAITRTESGGQRSMAAWSSFEPQTPKRLNRLEAEIVRESKGPVGRHVLFYLDYQNPLDAPPQPMSTPQLATITGRYEADILGLQQFPDAHTVGRACVQSLIATRISLDNVQRQLMRERVEINFIRYGSQSIVDLLGLQKEKEKDATRVRVWSPFTLTARLSLSKVRQW